MLPNSQEQALQFALKLRSDRKNWDTLFERLALAFHPNRTGFTSERTDGEELFDHLNSSMPALARRSLSASVSTMLRPAGRRWFQGKSKVPMLQADSQVRQWLQMTTEIMYAYMYDPRAQMEMQLAMADDDLVTFGNGVVRVGWDRVKKHLRFRTRSLAGSFYVVDATGNVIGLVSFEKWTLRQIRERFGDDKLTKGMRQSMTGGSRPDLDKEFELVHIVIPAADAKAFKMPFRQPFTSLWMSVGCKEALESRGFDYFPYVCPRWDQSTGEIYARSPAMVALGSAQLYQAMTETMVDAGEKVLNPPTWGVADMINGQLDLSAGGFTPVEMLGPQGGAPINPIQLGTLPAQIFEFMQTVADEIGAAFYRDILELPSARDQDLTATEINARLDQYMRQAAPVFGRIEHNYNAPLVNTVYRILSAEGVLPPKPDVVAEVEAMAGEDVLEFEYESPIKLARDKAEAMKVLEGMGTIAQAAASFGPEAAQMVAENFNPDAFARYMSARLDIPEILMSPMEQMMAQREARMQQMQQMQMAEMAGKAGPGLAAVGRLVPESAKAGLIETGGAEQALLPAPDMIDFGEIEGLAGEIV